MLLHNQTKHTLNWDASGVHYTWAPWGSLEVPDELVEHLKLQRVPVGEVPVPPQTKARTVVDEEAAAFRADEVRALKRRAEDAEAALESAREAVKAAELRRTQAEERAGKLADRVAALEAELASAREDTRAAESLLQEQAREHEAAREKAALAQAGKQKKGDAQKSPGG